MARGISITPEGGSPTSLTPRPGSIKLAFENKDVGGDGIPYVRLAAPMRCDFEVVVDGTAPTAATLLGLRTPTNKDAGAAAVVNFIAAISSATYTFADASVQASLEGDGAMIAKITIKGNVTVT